MKKNLNKQAMLAALAGAALIYGLPAIASAAVSGACSSCHTMHNSQNGSTMASGTAAGDPAHGTLLRSNCVGCHGTDDLKFGTGGAPAVLRGTAPDTLNNTLPGGFIRLANNANTYHNVVTAGAAVDRFTLPPGYDNVLATSLGLPNNWNPTVNQLTCAGTYGCHGDHSKADPAAAISGGHHATGPSNGFRMLRNVQGLQSPDYTVTGNIYKAVHLNDGTNNTTMSYLCAQCHGNFHGSGTDTRSAGGAWVRHPSDFKLSSAFGTGDAYASYGTGPNPYTAQVPVGFAQVATVAVNTGNTEQWGAGSYTDPIVMCTSCHYAHGSGHAALLRWDYTGMSAGTTGGGAGTGCFKCHTNKDGV